MLHFINIMKKTLKNGPQYIKSKDVSKEDKNLAAIMHLSILAGLLLPFVGILVPIIIWVLKKNESPYIDDQGKEAINFIINIFIVGIFVGILCMIVVGFILLVPLALYLIIAPIVAAAKCSDGVYYKYPFIFRFIN
jgi:uncharacterized Tic20 family protein